MRTSVSGSRVYYRRASDTTARTLEIWSLPASRPHATAAGPPHHQTHPHDERECLSLSSHPSARAFCEHPACVEMA